MFFIRFQRKYGQKRVPLGCRLLACDARTRQSMAQSVPSSRVRRARKHRQKGRWLLYSRILYCTLRIERWTVSRTSNLQKIVNLRAETLPCEPDLSSALGWRGLGRYPPHAIHCSQSNQRTVATRKALRKTFNRCTYGTLFKARPRGSRAKLHAPRAAVLRRGGHQIGSESKQG